LGLGRRANLHLEHNNVSKPGTGKAIARKMAEAPHKKKKMKMMKKKNSSKTKKTQNFIQYFSIVSI
jgi:hypothetical protein